MLSDDDIKKIASQLTEVLATKTDLLEVKLDLQKEIIGTKEALMALIAEVDHKAETILTMVDEVDKTTTDHQKRLRKVETIPAIAQHIK